MREFFPQPWFDLLFIGRFELHGIPGHFAAHFPRVPGVLRVSGAGEAGGTQRKPFATGVQGRFVP